MHLAGKVKRRLVDEINITPLTDVFLVLLIIMMVMAPALKMTRMDIRAPEVEQGAKLDMSRLLVEVTKEGTYFVAGNETAEGELPLVLTLQNKEPAGERKLIVQGDKEALSKHVVAIFRAAKAAQYKEVTLAVGTKSVTQQPAVPGEAPGANPPPAAAAPEPAKP